MVEKTPKPNEPHDQFIKQFVPIVLKHLFESETSVSVQLSEELAIDVLCRAINIEGAIAPAPDLGLLGRLVAIHPTVIIEHYSGYLDLEDVDSCILRSAIYWELNKGKSDTGRKIRVTKDSVLNPHPLHLDRPFTWIFAAKCSENTLKRWNAAPAPEFGAHVYRLAAPGSCMGIVDIESLPYNAHTMLIKMLGKAESAKRAFADILKLDPGLELRNDIIEVSLRHCIYLEEFRSQLTPEELDFMTYLQEVEEAYQRWVKQRQAEGKIEGIQQGIREGKIASIYNMVRAKFGKDALTLNISDRSAQPQGGDRASNDLSVRLSQLTEPQLDEFTSKIFQWQEVSEMIAWLQELG